MSHILNTLVEKLSTDPTIFQRQNYFFRKKTSVNLTNFNNYSLVGANSTILILTPQIYYSVSNYFKGGYKNYIPN